MAGPIPAKASIPIARGPPTTPPPGRVPRPTCNRSIGPAVATWRTSRRRAPRRGTHRFDRKHLAGAALAIQEHRLAADAGAIGLGHSQRERRGDRRIHDIAAATKHRQPGRRGVRMAARDDVFFSNDGLLGRHRRQRRGQCAEDGSAPTPASKRDCRSSHANLKSHNKTRLHASREASTESDCDRTSACDQSTGGPGQLLKYRRARHTPTATTPTSKKALGSGMARD